MAGSVDGEHGFQIAPMLDILFVLLLFFMVSAGAQKHEASLTTQLPGSGGPAGQVPAQLTIDPDGEVSINGAATGDDNDDHSLPATRGRLKAIVQQFPDRPVVITPSRTTRQQRVIDVLNACAVAGVHNLAFGTPGD